uniref:J domain-containing protein n=2 Tax=Mesocestoides corti TaxID=53468 RepID=A0A5K3FIT7_MESCO
MILVEMRCYYDVLGVEKTADLGELRKSYYKASLKWHPDKNPTDEATAKFQEIQEAYRVLSDVQERAWYDRHRDEILRGGQGGVNGEYKEERLDVFQFFSRSCFKNFDDGPKGFYTVFRKVFNDISAEERRACDYSSSSNSDEDDTTKHSNANGTASFPTFGHANSDYESVVRPFYVFWEGFVTRKSYSWVEPYDTRRMTSRIERRAAEAENRKAREAAKKERNEEIRQLVAFVHRRDKRVEAERVRLVAAAQHAHARNKEQAKKVRQKNAADLELAWDSELANGGLATQWADEMEKELARIEAELEGKKRLRVAPDNFTNAGASSTDSLDLKAADACSNSGDSRDASDDDSESGLYCVACNKHFASAAAMRNHEASKKHKKQADLLRLVLLEEERELATLAESDLQRDELFSDDEEKIKESQPQSETKLTKRAKKAERRRQRATEKLKEVDESQSVVTNQYQGNACDDAAVSATGVENVHPKKAKNPMPNTNAQTQDRNFVCLVCKNDFPSKNKLFGHIKETGHAVLKTNTSKTRKGKRN